MIGIIDFGGGNLFSLQEALTRLQRDHRIITTAGDLDGLETAILPGVGAYGVAMARLAEMDLIDPIKRFAGAGRRLLGICLGMQLLVDESEEFGAHGGLGLIPGQARLIPAGNGEAAIRIPNMGWRRLYPSAIGGLDMGPEDAALFAYFVHSYYVEVDDTADLMAWTPVNGRKVAAIIRRDNVFGFQFHPEKSGEAGIRLLESAINW